VSAGRRGGKLSDCSALRLPAERLARDGWQCRRAGARGWHSGCPFLAPLHCGPRWGAVLGLREGLGAFPGSPRSRGLPGPTERPAPMEGHLPSLPQASSACLFLCTPPPPPRSHSLSEGSISRLGAARPESITVCISSGGSRGDPGPSVVKQSLRKHAVCPHHCVPATARCWEG